MSATNLHRPLLDAHKSVVAPGDHKCHAWGPAQRRTSNTLREGHRKSPQGRASSEVVDTAVAGAVCTTNTMVCLPVCYVARPCGDG